MAGLGEGARMWPGFLSRWLGLHRRRKGFYDRATLACFAASWANSASPTDLLRYALFRRDLGKPLPRRWGGALVSALPLLSASERRLALGLLAESAPERLAVVERALLLDGASLPAIASRVFNADKDFGDLARVDTCQLAWRAAFADCFRAALSSGGVAVVGNAATLIGLGGGAQIDRHGMVVRFNHFMGGDVPTGDVGIKTDVWVLSPGYEGPVPEQVAWVVMSGPDMRFRLSDWHNVLPLVRQGVPVLTIPLAVWQQVTRFLQAPPSAGVLLLAYLNSLSGGRWQGMSVAGIGTGMAGSGRYHASLPRHMASSRHAWEKEAKLVRTWRQQGLSEIPACSGALSCC